MERVYRVELKGINDSNNCWYLVGSFDTLKGAMYCYNCYNCYLSGCCKRIKRIITVNRVKIMKYKKY